MKRFKFRRFKRHKDPVKHSELQLEHLADLLKERIYASLALLAVLISLDVHRATTTSAATIVGGTALSLWAASLVSAQMAYRMVLRQVRGEHALQERLVRQHSPLLASAVLPLLLIGLAGVHIFSLQTAITVSIVSIVLSLAVWSLATARAMGASGIATFILGGVEIMIGLAVVGLKVALEH